MKRIKYALLAIWLLTSIIGFSQSKNPYKSIGKKSQTLTLTKGKYEEFFDQDSIQQVGSVLMNVRTMRVVKLLDEKDTKQRLENEKDSRFLSVDPLMHSYPMSTPYAYAMNDVIRCIDLDGAEKKVVVHYLDGFYGDGTPKINKTTVDINKNIFYVDVYTATGKPIGNGKKYAGTEVYYALPDGRFVQGKTMYEEISEDNPKPSANYDYTQNVIPGKMDEDNNYVLHQYLKYQDFAAYADIINRDLKAPDNASTLEDLGGVQAALTVIGYANVKGGTSGAWIEENQAGRSAFSNAYQKQITGREGQDFIYNGVRFDGIANGVLQEAKGKYAFLLEKGWAQDRLVDQANRQIKAANGAKIEWHFAEQEAANTVQQLFKDRGVRGIDVYYTPAIKNP